MKLNSLFTDGVVLQSGKPIRVFGTGDGTVTVQFLGESKTGVFSGGSWCLELDSRPAGGPYELCVVMDGAETVVRDVMIGEVILCAGQSNMQLKLSETQDDVTPESDPMLRLFTVIRPEEGDYFTDRWARCEAETAGHWSAIGFHLGHMLRREKGTAVGVVACYQGASMIQPWIDERLLHSTDLCLPDEVRHPDLHVFSIWNKDGFLYHLMFETLVPFSMRCAVWYQGESNTSVAEAAVYDRLLALMIGEWRENLKDARLPFVIVQIHSFAAGAPGWAALQEAQLRAARDIPAAAPAVIRDLGERELIHPIHKKPVAERIYRAMKTLL